MNRNTNQRPVLRRAIRCLALVMVLALLNLSLTAAAFSRDSITLDVEQDHIYHCYPISELLEDARRGAAARAKYNNRFIMTAGIVSSVYPNSRELTLRAADNTTDVIGVNAASAADSSVLLSLKPGDAVRVYGQVSFSLTQGIPSIKADRTEACAPSEISAVSNTVWCFPDGTSYDNARLPQQELCGGRIRYFLPAGWKDVQESVDNGFISGHLYRLNEIRSSGFRTAPEQLFVYYFDNEKNLADLKDRGTNVKKIEVSIIRNILPNERVKTTSIDRHRTMDGTELHYYSTSYTDAAGKSHHVEFVFAPDGQQGICCFMYIFDESVHRQDILYVLNTLKLS